MKRTIFAAHGAAALLCLSASLAIAASLLYAFRSNGAAGTAIPVVCALIGAGLGFVKARRRQNRRGPHRLVMRRGTWLVVLPCILTALVSLLTATPPFAVWLIAALAGAGVVTVLAMAHQIVGKNIRVPAIGGAVLGVALVLVLSQGNLREPIEASARANGVPAEQLDRLPQSLTVNNAEALARDPRTGYLAGSLREARTATVNSQFTQSIQTALLLAVASLIVSLFIPRRIKPALPHTSNQEPTPREPNHKESFA
jgi:hypothetical protein